jgi:hypothetical protein
MSAWTVLAFTRLRVTLGATSSVSAVFDGDLGRHTIAALDLSKEHVTRIIKGRHHWILLSGIAATMSDWLVGQVTGAFPTYDPTDHTLGTITVTLRLN